MIIQKPYVLIETVKTTPEVTVFKFKAQDNSRIDFVPGMFAMLFYKNQATGEQVGRAFSIANSPNSDYLEFFIALINGRMTSKLAQAKTGDVYYVSAPYGQFKFADGDKKLLFLAGGTGIAPFFSALRQMKEQGQVVDCALMYSTKYSNDIIMKEELDSLTDSLKTKLVITVTRPADGEVLPYETGHIGPDMILKHVADAKGRVCYICGPPAFVKAMKEGLLSIGTPQENIKAEMWG